MRILNKKGDATERVVLIVFAIVGLLIVGFLAIALSVGATRKGSTEAELKGCEWSLEQKAEWNAKLSGLPKRMEEKAEEKSPTWAIGDWIIGEGVRGAGEEIVEKLIIESDKCVEDIDIQCPEFGTASADRVAKCLYENAAKTFYILRGAKYQYSKTDYTLMNISVAITKPGELLLKGSCSNYITGGTYNGENAGIKWVNQKDDCNVTFSVIDERTMTLAMIEECQNIGPDIVEPEATLEATGYTIGCKCFADGLTGYDSDNGLPNIDFGGSENSSIVRNDIGSDVTYPGPNESESDKYLNYEGCGNQMPDEHKPTQGNMITPFFNWDDAKRKDLIDWVDDEEDSLYVGGKYLVSVSTNEEMETDPMYYTMATQVLLETRYLGEIRNESGGGGGGGNGGYVPPTAVLVEWKLNEYYDFGNATRCSVGDQECIGNSDIKFYNGYSYIYGGDYTHNQLQGRYQSGAGIYWLGDDYDTDCTKIPSENYEYYEEQVVGLMEGEYFCIITGEGYIAKARYKKIGATDNDVSSFEWWWVGIPPNPTTVSWTEQDRYDFEGNKVCRSGDQSCKANMDIIFYVAYTEPYGNEYTRNVIMGIYQSGAGVYKLGSEHETDCTSIPSEDYYYYEEGGIGLYEGNYFCVLTDQGNIAKGKYIEVGPYDNYISIFKWWWA